MIYLWVLPLGLEHLQTGIEFLPVDDKTTFSGVCIHADSPTIFRAWSHHPFKTTWHVAGERKLTLLASHCNEWTPPMPETSDMIRARVRSNNRLQQPMRSDSEVA